MTCEDKDLKYLQSLSLEEKIQKTKERIIEWYTYFDGKVYVSFSGGKDSTVLLNIARKLYPDIEAVFVDTGLEFPEIREFVKATDNVTWLRPKMPFTEVIKKYGWPIVSKEQSQYIQQYISAKSEKTKNTRWNGNKWGRGKISDKWKYLIGAPFKISDQCCNVMKKKPIYIYEKKTSKMPIIGTMASESAKRTQDFNRFSCNSFNTKRPTSKPLSFWHDSNVWDYLKINKVRYSQIYDMGYERTGCAFCLFGHHISKVNRLELMKQTHPKLYKYCMEKLGMKEVLEWYPIKKDLDQIEMELSTN